MPENKLYAALTADLVASRQAEPSHRKKIQRVVLEVLEDLNGARETGLARPLVLTAGDEIQGLFRRPSGVVEVVRLLKDRLFGAGAPDQDVAFGLGRGTLSTGLMAEAESVEHLDGPCFHLAREALIEAKKRRIWGVFRGFGEVADGTLTSLFDLMGSVRAGWTAKQGLYIRDLRRLGKRVEVARLHDVSPSVITESLQLSRFEAVARGEEAARVFLRQFDPAPQAGREAR